ncbi:MAG: DNA helicase RecG, partial [Cyanobacteria bacterium P01_A01_bin.83]
MGEHTVDWIRLQKALSVEAERGYSDLVGNQFRFSEFLCLSLGKPPRNISAGDKIQWHDIAQKFASYASLSAGQRKQLVIGTRNFLHKQKAIAETPVTTPQPKTPRTAALSSSNKTYFKQKITLDQPLGQVIDIGRRSSYLERLGLYTVRDLLFYYPRDHLDYARQVQITHLEPGETVTVIGTVVKCRCFSSPNKKYLTIFELILSDATGRLKINRFLTGTRFNNPGSQARLRNKYPVGSIVAASGLVKYDKRYGISLDKPEIEVLDGAGASIESIKIGRLLPVYPLTEGVPADTVRKSVIAALPAAAQLPDPLPSELRNQYGLVKLKKAIACIHYPENREELTHARRRLVFDEFFYLQLGFLQRRQQLKQTQLGA